jgi:hypothetical protein
LFRDMLGLGTLETPEHPAGHTDFENSLFFTATTACRTPNTTYTTGLVASLLDAEGKPVLASTLGSNCMDQITSSTTFATWYRNDPLNAVVASTLVLVRQGTTTTYLFDSNTDEPYRTRGGFFPLNGQGWQSAASCAPCEATPSAPGCDQCPPARSGNNFFFTSELRYPFTYHGGEVLAFSGDDDAWGVSTGG